MKVPVKAVKQSYGNEVYNPSAVRAAFEKILERATLQPEKFVMGLLERPDLAGDIRNFDEVVEILLKKGQEAKLQQLSLHPKLRGDAKKFLINKLHFA